MSCAPLAGRGAGGGAWRLVNSTRSPIWRRPWGWPNAMSADSCGSLISRRGFSSDFVYKREVPAVTLLKLTDVAALPWHDQLERVFD